MTESERLGVHCINEPSKEALENFRKVLARIAMRHVEEEFQCEQELKRPE